MVIGCYFHRSCCLLRWAWQYISRTARGWLEIGINRTNRGIEDPSLIKSFAEHRQMGNANRLNGHSKACPRTICSSRHLDLTCPTLATTLPLNVRNTPTIPNKHRRRQRGIYFHSRYIYHPRKINILYHHILCLATALLLLMLTRNHRHHTISKSASQSLLYFSRLLLLPISHKWFCPGLQSWNK